MLNVLDLHITIDQRNNSDLEKVILVLQVMKTSINLITNMNCRYKFVVVLLSLSIHY